MARLYLIRHATIDPLGQSIAGRAPGVSLNAAGREQAARLADWLAESGIQRIFSSPMERTRETADALAQRLKLPVEVAHSLNEIDFGRWTGERFESLDADLRWSLWNSYRSGTAAPGGEWMIDVQTRMVTFLLTLHERWPSETMAVVSHGDPIRSAVAYFLGIPLDLFQRLEISPASVSIVELNETGPHVLCVNHLGPAFPFPT